VAKEEKFSTIYSGMDVEPFLTSGSFRSRIRADFGIRDEHVVIGKIARLFHLKGHEDMIRSAKRVVSKYPNVRFLFVGDGLLRDQLDRQIKDLGLEEYFCFTGLVDPSEVPKLIAAMDVLAHASYREGLARALPQALISGVPAISYDIDGAREVVLDEITGLLVPAGDIERLSDAIEKLVEDASYRQTLGAEGRRRFADRFRHQVMTREIRSLYVKLLES
jgi:glycosyltransferase involved in cell wall biosynthesis